MQMEGRNCISIEEIVELLWFPVMKKKDFEDWRRLAGALRVRRADYIGAESSLNNDTGTWHELLVRILHCWLRNQRRLRSVTTLRTLYDMLQDSNFPKLSESLTKTHTLGTLVSETQNREDQDFSFALDEEKLSARSAGFVGVDAVVEVMLEDEVLLCNWKQLGSIIDSNKADFKEIENLFQVGRSTIREVLRSILELWVAKKGRSATVTSLCRDLQKMEYLRVAEELEENFGNAVVALREPKRGHQLVEYKPHSTLSLDKKLKGDVPTRSCKYNFVEFLGIGSFGIVFSAIASKQLIAIKVLFPQEDDAQEDMTREFSIMSRPDNHHRNVVKLLRLNVLCGRDFQLEAGDLVTRPNDPVLKRELTKIENERRPFCCLELELCGKTLRNELTESLFKFRRQSKGERFLTIIQITSDIAAGLKFLHSREILHRNLTPENVYFSVGPGASVPMKIGDFGECRKAPSKSSGFLNTVAHTHSSSLSDLYKAPEVLHSVSGHRTMPYGKNSDWYSFGLILYELFYPTPIEELSNAFRKLRRSGKFPSHHSIGGSEGGGESTLGKVQHIILCLTEEKSESRKEVATMLENTFDIQGYLSNHEVNKVEGEDDAYDLC